jgi:hypothetical protein
MRGLKNLNICRPDDWLSPVLSSTPLIADGCLEVAHRKWKVGMRTRELGIQLIHSQNHTNSPIELMGYDRKLEITITIAFDYLLKFIATGGQALLLD